MKRKMAKQPSRPATYPAAMRIARIVHGLVGRPFGWSFGAIQDELGISERTLLRYLKAARTELVDADGRPIIEEVRHGDRRVLQLASAVRTPSSTAYQALLFYFAVSVLQVLDGILKDGVTGLWDSFYRMLPPDQRRRLAHFDRKFFSVAYVPKDYRQFDEQLDTILRCLVHQHTLRVVNASPWRETTADPEPQDFDPYTLAMYRGGLYLIGRSHKHRRIVYLAVERIREATMLPDRFAYPERYSPVRHTQGTFGIVDGPQTTVAIRIHGEEGAALLRARRLHPTQAFHEQPDGSTLLTMTVRGTAELENWVLSLGPHVEVLGPPELRKTVARSLRAAAAQYRARPARRLTHGTM